MAWAATFPPLTCTSDAYIHLYRDSCRPIDPHLSPSLLVNFSRVRAGEPMCMFRKKSKKSLRDLADRSWQGSSAGSQPRLDPRSKGSKGIPPPSESRLTRSDLDLDDKQPVPSRSISIQREGEIQEPLASGTSIAAFQIGNIEREKLPPSECFQSLHRDQDSACIFTHQDKTPTTQDAKLTWDRPRGVRVDIAVLFVCS